MKKHLFLLSLSALFITALQAQQVEQVSQEEILENVQNPQQAQQLSDRIADDINQTMKQIEEIDTECAGKFDPSSADFDSKCLVKASEFMYDKVKLSRLYAKKAWNSELIQKLRQKWPTIKVKVKKAKKGWNIF